MNARGIPVFVDAASQVYPPQNMGKYLAMGADLVCFGAKYFHAPNSTGVLCGRKDLVEVAAFQGFVSFEANDSQSFARPMKLDRQEVVAVVIALQEWMRMDHAIRFEGYERRAHELAKHLEGIPGVCATPTSQAVQVTFDESTLGKTTAQIESELKAGDPSIWAHTSGDAIVFSAVTLVDGDEQIIADRLKSLLAD